MMYCGKFKDTNFQSLKIWTPVQNGIIMTYTVLFKFFWTTDLFTLFFPSFFSHNINASWLIAHISQAFLIAQHDTHQMLIEPISCHAVWVLIIPQCCQNSSVWEDPSTHRRLSNLCHQCRNWFKHCREPHLYLIQHFTCKRILGRFLKILNKTNHVSLA